MGWLLGSGGKVKHVCLLSSNPSRYIRTVSSKLLTVAINELLSMKNAGAQIAMDFS